MYQKSREQGYFGLNISYNSRKLRESVSVCPFKGRQIEKKCSNIFKKFGLRSDVLSDICDILSHNLTLLQTVISDLRFQ